MSVRRVLGLWLIALATGCVPLAGGGSGARALAVVDTDSDTDVEDGDTDVVDSDTDVVDSDTDVEDTDPVDTADSGDDLGPEPSLPDREDTDGGVIDPGDPPRVGPAPDGSTPACAAAPVGSGWWILAVLGLARWRRVRRA